MSAGTHALSSADVTCYRLHEGDAPVIYIVGWHGITTLSQSAEMTDPLSSLMAKATILIKEARWREALECLDQAEVLTRRDFGEEDKRLAAVLELKCRTLKGVGRTIDAERAMHEATAIHLKHHRGRGQALARLQKYTEAETEFREALRICEKAFGGEHRETATCQDNLASCLRSQSRFEEALVLANRALETRSVVLGTDHGHTAASLSNVGHLYRILGRFDQAESLLRRSQIVREKVYGPDHPCVAESLDRIASLYRDMGRFDEAVTLGQRAVAIRTEQLGLEHPLTAAAAHNLALSRERRVTTVSPATPEVNSDGCEPAVTEPVVVSVTSPRSPASRHSVGYWIVGAAVAGMSTAAAIFIYAPWIAVLFTIVMVVIMLMAFSGVEWADAWWNRGGDRIRKLVTPSEAVDRDSVVLGGSSSAVGARIDSISRKGPLSVTDARELVRFGVNPLDLAFVHSLTQAAADELVKHRGTLKLNGLAEVRSKLAKSLRWHRGRLELDGVHELTEAAAAHIARHEGDLCFNGLHQVPPFVAKHLAHHRGALELNGVRSLTEEAAGWIIKHRGSVQLHACRLTSDETKRILKAAPQIEFPNGELTA